MIDGPYVGWKPTPDDWNRIKVGSVLYVDREGFLSCTEYNRGPFQKLGGDCGCDREASLYSLGSCRGVYTSENPPADTEPLRQRARMNESGRYGAGQSGDLPPADFYVEHPNLCGNSAMSSPSEFNTPGKRSGTDKGSTPRIAGDRSSVLPMGLVIYNDLMMDVEGATRSLGQELQDSIPFGLPAPPTSAGQRPDQGYEPQLQNTEHG